MFTTNNFEKISFDVLLDKNAGELKYEFDILVLFIHWYMMENDFFIHENNQIRIRSSQPNQLFFKKRYRFGSTCHLV
jgi:hypothetical protein